MNSAARKSVIARSATPEVVLPAVPIAGPEVQRSIGIVKHRQVSMSSIAADLCELLRGAID
jgi:hypothetical protein